MKSNANKLFSIFIALSMLLLTFFTVSAATIEKKDPTSSPTLTLPDPTATIVTGGAKLSIDLLPILNLPGTVTLTNGTPSPKGFPEGTKQFEGQGLKLTGLTYGTAKVCFPITSVGQGWGGKVAYWTGSKWQLLDTTITPAADEFYSWACANVTQNGTYALIAWVVDSSKLPSSTPSCGYEITDGYGSSDAESEEITGGERGVYDQFNVFSDTNLAGKSVTVSLYSASPSGSFTLSNSFSGTFYQLDTYEYSIDISPVVSWTLLYTNEENSFLLDFGSCKQIVISRPS